MGSASTVANRSVAGCGPACRSQASALGGVGDSAPPRSNRRGLGGSMRLGKGLSYVFRRKR